MILITRPFEAALVTKEKLEAIGHKAKIFSLLEIEYLTPAVSLDDECLLITSKNAVYMLKTLVVKSKKIMVIGKKTAAKIKDMGYKVKAVFEDSADLLSNIDKIVGKEERILYLSGNHISSNLDVVLKEKGLAVRRIICYKSNAVNNIPSGLLENVQVIMFYSARTAEIFANLNKANLQSITAICISSNTAGKIGEIGFKKVLTALKPTEEQMIDALNHVR